jgi:hypothetical protein
MVDMEMVLNMQFLVYSLLLDAGDESRRRRPIVYKPSTVVLGVQHQEKSAIMELHGATWSRVAMIGYHVHACPCSSMGSMQLLIPR